MLRLLRFCFDIVLMALFCTAIRWDQLSLLRFPFLAMLKFSCVGFRLFDAWNLHLFFFPFLYSGYFWFVDACIICMVSGGHNQFFLSIHRRYLQCWRVLVLFLFLTHKIDLHPLWDVWFYASKWVFLFSGPFVEVLSSSLRMVLSILQGVQPRYLSLWWDFYYVVWFQ